MHRYIERKPALLFILSFALFLTAACSNTASTGAGATTASPEVAATVNDKKILMSEVERVLNTQAQEQQAQLAPLELAQARLQILDGLIQQEVLFQRAEKEKLLPSEDDITQAIAQLKQQGSLTEEEFRRRLQESGQTEEQLRNELRRQLAIQKLQNNVTASISNIRDREVEDFYNNNRASFVSRRGVSLAAVVVDPRNNGAEDDAKSEAEATLKASAIHQQIKNGADFATVARARSEDQSNVRGGDLGFISEEQLQQGGFPPDLIQRFFAMEVGSVTEPVRTSDGRLTIFKLQGKRLQNENLTLDNPAVRSEINQALTNSRRSLLSAVLLETAMNEAEVENYLAQSVLNNPNELSGVRPAGAQAPAATGAATPTTTPTVAATPAATPTR